jgi:hypothetical protein
MQKYASLPVTELNDRPAGHDQGQTPPCGGGNYFLENKPTNQNTHDREESDIDADQLREIPFDRVDHQAVATQGSETGDDERNITPPQPAANRRITANLQDRRAEKNQPGQYIHVPFIAFHYIVARSTRREVIESQLAAENKSKTSELAANSAASEWTVAIARSNPSPPPAPARPNRPPWLPRSGTAAQDRAAKPAR